MKSVKSKILLVMILTVVVGLVAVGGSSVAMSLRSSMAMLEDAMAGTAGVAADRVAEELVAYKNIAQTAGTLPELSDDTVSVSEKQDMLNNLTEEYGMTRANLLSTNGVSLFDGTDFSGREYFTRAMQGESYVSTPVLSEITGELSIIVAAPVWRNGEIGSGIMGVVYFVPNEQFLNDIMASVHISANSALYMIDKDGNTIADVNPELVGQENIEQQAQQDSSLQALAGYHADMRNGNSGVGEYTIDGVDKLLAYAPVDGTDGWSLAINMPKADFMGDVYTAIFVIAVIVVVVTVIGVILAIRLARSIGKPIQQCAERIDLLAKGNLSDPVPEAKSKDEIGRIAEATEEIVSSIQNVIGDVGYLLQEMSSGNFNVRSRDYSYYVGDFDQLLQSVRKINISMSDTLEQIRSASEQVSAGAEQVSSGAQSLAQGATEQASAVQELSATITDISHDSQNTAQQTMEARESAEEAGTELSASNDYIAKLDTTMGNISESSQKISKIISTIEDIAFQTNILALNAAVEAARAGQAGKGFAVVADEVRNLASKSDQAAKDTKALIEKSIEAVDSGVEMMNNVKHAVSTVMGSAGKAISNMQSVAESVERQNDSILQITQGIDQISSVVQTNSATAEESAAASEELSGQAEMLKALVGSFKLRENNDQDDNAMS